MSMRDALRKHSHFLSQIRQFFSQMDIIEVQTPQLLNHPISDVYIDSLTAKANGQNKYLHTSPELAMKKLLANGSGDIYQICQVFRDNEQGAHNFNEFTMLEYYRLDFDIHQLMDEIVELMQHLGFQGEVSKLSYAQAFSEYANIDILNSDFNALKVIANTHGLCSDFEWIEDLQILLFTHLIEPKLNDFPLCFIYDYPQQQSALSKVEGKIAHRFELYIYGVEIANGYDELQQANEYRQRFEGEINKRCVLGKALIDLDEGFLSSLKPSLPPCSGVAIGLERLLSKIDLK